MATHLVQKPGESVWYVRMAVPIEVRHAFGGRAKLIKTTGTSNKTEAMDRRLSILAMWKEQIHAAKEAKKANRDLWRHELSEKGAELARKVDTGLLNAIKRPPKGKGGTEAEIIARAEQFERNKELLLYELKGLEDAGATGLVEAMRQRLETPPTSMVEAIQHGAHVSQTVSVMLAERRYGLSPMEVEEAIVLAVAPDTYKPVSPITPSRLASFRSFREKAEIAAKTIDQQASKLDMLSLYLRDQGKRLNRETVGAWLESEKLAKLSSKTKAQYLLAGATFWKWALKHDMRWREEYSGQDNPFKEQELPQVRGKAKAEAARKAFTPDELQQLYRAAKAADSQKLCDLIALGAYTGCRIEELAQLRVESIITIEGIASFKIADSKTAAGIREVPIHPALESSVERLASTSKDGYLLSGSTGRGNQYGIRSDSLSKAFGRLKTAHDFGKHHVFHSVRAMVVTQLSRAGVPGPTIANIVGHETGIVTFDVYDEGASPRQKLDAILKLPTLSL
jgi:integrase